MAFFFGNRTVRFRTSKEDLLQEVSKLKENLKMAQEKVENLQYENRQLRDSQARLEKWNTELAQRLENLSMEKKTKFFRAEDGDGTKIVIVEPEVKVATDAPLESEQKVAEVPADAPWYEVIYIEDVRASNVLRRHGVDTIGELLSCTALDILDTRNCGKATLNSIVYALGEAGLHLATEDNIKSQRRINRYILPALKQLTKIETLMEYGLSAGTYNVFRLHGYKMIYDFYDRRGTFVIHQPELKESEYELKNAIVHWEKATILSYNLDHI